MGVIIVIERIQYQKEGLYSTEKEASQVSPHDAENSKDYSKTEENQRSNYVLRKRKKKKKEEEEEREWNGVKEGSIPCKWIEQ